MSSNNLKGGYITKTVIQPIQPKELSEAAKVLGQAFATQPNTLAILGEQNDKQRRVEAMFRIMLERLPEQVIVAKKDGQIVGVLRMMEWPYCQMTPIQSLKILPAMISIFGGATLRGLKLRSAWAKHDPKEPHWHVDPIGVVPELQGQGIGSQLLRHYCEHVDALSQTAYHETDRPENVPLYERFGYSVIGQESILGVPNWFMWRPARGQATKPSRGNIK